MFKIKREVQKDYKTPGCLLRVIHNVDHSGDKIDNPRIRIEAVASDGSPSNFGCQLIDLLDLIIALWPDEVAYQFKKEEH